MTSIASKNSIDMLPNIIKVSVGVISAGLLGYYFYTRVNAKSSP